MFVALYISFFFKKKTHSTLVLVTTTNQHQREWDREANIIDHGCFYPFKDDHAYSWLKTCLD
jgi:hypothetical protein